MKLKEKLRAYWHDIYYSVVPKSGVKFALRCQEFSGKVDLHKHEKSLSGVIRFYLHISLCQACANYNKSSLILRAALRKMIRQNENQKQLERLNQELITKYANGKSQ